MLNLESNVVKWSQRCTSFLYELIKIYPNNTPRIVMHLLFWLILFIFILRICIHLPNGINYSGAKTNSFGNHFFFVRFYFSYLNVTRGGIDVFFSLFEKLVSAMTSKWQFYDNPENQSYCIHIIYTNHVFTQNQQKSVYSGMWEMVLGDQRSPDWQMSSFLCLSSLFVVIHAHVDQFEECCGFCW